jgi:major membrane immunogen (membrane-anchored lipoprotein)
MIQRLAFLCLISALLLTGCATKNDAGVVLHKKPDLSKVTPGTPVSKVAGLKKPIKREVITKGELKGAQAWLYEWDAPDDEVNNKMFTSVVVKDGIITGFYEETPDKWRKDPEMLKQAKLQSAFENYAGHMAQAAQYQAAAGYLAGYGAQMANRAASAPMEAYNNAYATSYKPWETAPSTVNYGMIGGGPIPFGGPRPNAMSDAPTYRTPGTASRVVGNQIHHGDGSTSRIQGDRIVHRDGSYSRIQGDTIVTSPGNDTSRIYGNRIQHSDGTSSRVQGNTIYHD